MNKNKVQKLSAMILVALFILPVFSVSLSYATPTDSTNTSQIMIESKIHPHLLEKTSNLDGDDYVEVVIKLHSLPETIKLQVKGNHQAAINALKTWAKMTQKDVIKAIKENGGIVLNTFWIDNIIIAKVKASYLTQLAELPQVERIFENFPVKLIEPAENITSITIDQQLESWGVEKIRVKEVWEQGITGQGVRVAVLDTGVDITHPALAGKMLTLDPENPYYPGGWMAWAPDGTPIQEEPHDTHWHGTHTSATVLGGDTENILIGVAPGATLMHGLVLPGGGGTFAQVLAGMQWAADPYFINESGSLVYTGLPAHVVSMSLGAPDWVYEVYNLDQYFESVIENMLLANVIVVAAIGNDGWGCADGPGYFWGVFGIGATDMNDIPAWFSGGKVIVDNTIPSEWPFFDTYPSKYVKPDFSAPGVHILSAIPLSLAEQLGWELPYGYASGTSMATPHVAGLVALVIQAAGWVNNTEVVDLPEKVYDILKESSIDLGAPGQDTRYGWGRIDAANAVAKALEYVKNQGVKGQVLDSETSEPVTWASVTVQETGYTVLVDKNGHFEIPLDPGTYTLEINAWGYETIQTTVNIVEGNYSQITVEAAKEPHGYLTGTLIGNNELPIAGATIAVLGAPFNVTTDESGNFETWLPEGNYSVFIDAPGFENYSTTVTISADETTSLGTIELDRLPRIAILWDSYAVYKDFAEYLGFYAKVYINLTELNEDLAYGFYDLVIYSGQYGTPYPSEEEFMKFLNLTDKYGASVIFMDSWGDFGYGVKVLSKYTGDPQVANFTCCAEVYLTIEAEHPILQGYNVGDTILLINWSDADIAWFENFSGTTIAGIVVNDTRIGDAIGVKELPSGSKWILMSSFAYTAYWNWPIYFTNDYWVILYNAIDYALTHELTVTVSKPITTVGDKVEVAISGGRPYDALNIYFDGEYVGKAVTDENGQASFMLKVPLALKGSHTITVSSSDGYYTGSASIQVTPKVEVHPTTATAPGTIKIVATGFDEGQKFYIFIDDNLMSFKTTNSSGAFTATINLPFMSSGNHKVQLVEMDTGDTYTATFTVTSQLDTLMNQIVSIAGDVAIIKNGTETITVKLDELNASVVALFEDQTGEIKALLQTSLGPVIADLDALKAMGNNALLLLTDINGTVSSIKQQLVAVANDVAIIKDGTETITVKLDELNATVIALFKDQTGEIKALLDTSLGPVITDLDTLKTLNKNIQDSVNSNNSQLQALQSRVNLLLGLIVITLILVLYDLVRKK